MQPHFNSSDSSMAYHISYLPRMNAGTTDSHQLSELDKPSSTYLDVVQHNQDALPAPPDGGYGWLCVLAQFLINGFTWGVAAVYANLGTPEIL